MTNFEGKFHKEESSMKKSMIAFVLVCTMLMSVLGMAAADGSYTPGTYTAEAKGMGGTVTVTVTVSENAITAVKAEGPDETPGLGVPALETVANAILEAQSADVDGVTGATVTSTAVKTAAAAALAEAAGETGVDKGNVPDGTYTGKAPSFGVMKEMELAVTFKDNAIVSIETVCAGSATQYNEDEYSNIYATVEEKLYPRIIEAQSLDVDAICGATVSSNAAKTILRNPAEVNIAISKPNEAIDQSAYICYENQKLGIIRSLFAEETPERVIIFASSKLKVKEVTKALKQMKLNVGEMHSDLEQAQREEVMYEFKAGRINILVATDIVARGIDIDDIRLVINYDVPHDSEDYVHRIGRTARANNDGVAITFVSEKEQGNFKNIEKFLDRDIYKISVPEELGEAPEYKPRAFDGGGRRGGHGNGRKPGGNKNGRNNNKGGKPRAKRPQNGGEKK